MKDSFKINRKSMLCLAILLSITASLFWQTFGVSAQEVNQKNFERYQERVKELKNSPVFAEFDDWIKQYISNNGGGNENLGKSLAIKRKKLIKELTQLDPKAALEKTISAERHKNLPSFVAENSEKRISANGDFLVYTYDEIDETTGNMAGSRTEREVVIGESRYKAFVYGRRESMTTKYDIPLQGIVIDDVMAVDENPARKIEAEEFASLAVDRSKLGKNGAAAEVGGKIAYFSNQSELDDFVNEQIEWESKIGPERTNEKLGSNERASLWTDGVKTALVIRVDFPDRQGEPIDVQNQPLTEARAQSLFANQVNPFYINNSYNKTSIPTAVVTPVLRLPQPTTFYTQGTNDRVLLTDARNAARAAGFETNNFNLDIVAFSRISGFSWSGLGFVGGKGSWLNGYFDLRVTAHELGHNYGLNHANLWRTTDGTTIGSGSAVEYGDSFDMMGVGANLQQYHFNTHYKRLLDWLTVENVQTVSSEGVYRIYAHDSTSSSPPTGVRALKIIKNSTRNYWVEFRQLFTNNSNAMNGALIRWDNQSDGNFRRTQLLDMTPNTSTTATDAPLVVGQSFQDSESQIKITVLGKGNTTPESLDIKVEMNATCFYSLGQATQNFPTSGGNGSFAVTAGAGCAWTAATSAPDWITINSGSSGSGNGTVSYTVAANTGNSRAGTINVGGQIYTVTQAGAGGGGGCQAAAISPGQPINGSLATSDCIFTGTTRYVDAYSFSGTAGQQIAVSMNSSAFDTYLYLVNSSNQTISSDDDGGGGTNSRIPGATGFFTLPSTGIYLILATSYSADSTGAYSINFSQNVTTRNRKTVGVFRPSNGITYMRNSNTGGFADINMIYGVAGDQSFAGDWNGDSVDSIGIYRNGVFYLRNSNTTGAADAVIAFGSPGDQPIAGDWNGDGIDTIGIYRPSTGVFMLRNSNTAGAPDVVFVLGNPGDVAIAGDWNGDGITTTGVFRPTNGIVYLKNANTSGNADIYLVYGVAGDKPLAGDWDGDGQDSIGIYRQGVFYLRNTNTQGNADIVFALGNPGDEPIAGDWDGAP